MVCVSVLQMRNETNERATEREMAKGHEGPRTKQGLTICTMIQSSLLPDQSDSHAKPSIATMWITLPPMGIKLSCSTEKRLVPSGWRAAFRKRMSHELAF